MESTIDHERAPDDSFNGSFSYEAAAIQAIQAASMNERSDSILIQEEESEDEEESDDNDILQHDHVGHHGDIDSATEQQKHKAQIINNMDVAKIHDHYDHVADEIIINHDQNNDNNYHHKDQSTVASSNRSAVSFENSLGSLTEWEHGSFSVPTKDSPLPATDIVTNASLPHEITNKDLPTTVEGILEACQVLPFTFQQLSSFWSRSEEEVVRALFHKRLGTATVHPPPQSFNYNIRRMSSLPVQNIMYLHSLFCTFSTPSPTMEEIGKIFHAEEVNRKMTVSLPYDPLISMKNSLKKPVVSLLQNPKLFIELPPPFQMAFLRILIRLLTNETDDEYDKECFLNCEWFQEDAMDRISFHRRKGNLSKIRSDLATLSEGDKTRSRSMAMGKVDQKEIQRRTSISATSSDFQTRTDIQSRTHDRINKMRKVRTSIADKHRKQQSWIIERLSSSSSNLPSKRPNQLYTIVRFRVGDVWKGNSAVSVLLDLFELIKDNHRHLLPPVSRLLGLLATAGLSIAELRRMLALAGAPVQSPRLLDRLQIVRAITSAAEGSSLSTFWAGKGSPRNFYTFGRSEEGLSRTIKSLPHWPFRNDFGMAMWFRCESFQKDNSSKLLAVTTPDGSGIEISLMPLGHDSTATIINVSTTDTLDSRDESTQSVTLQNCIILPRVWYHLAVRHTRSRLKGVFGMSARQQVSIMLDGKLMLTEPLRFPRISNPDNDFKRIDVKGKKLLHTLRPQNNIALTIQFGANFEGQAGALYLFNDNVSDSTLRVLYEVTAGTKVTKKESIADSSGKTQQSVVDLNDWDAEELVVARQEEKKQERILKDSVISVVDMVGVDEEQEGEVSSELTGASLASKLFLVWDPRRAVSDTTLDLHSGAHALMDRDHVHTWNVDGAKDLIGSIGGIQALLPVFGTLLSSSVEKLRRKAKDSTHGEENAGALIPNLMSMVAAFLRNHDKNAREMMRCGGIDIIEELLQKNKSLSDGTDTLFGMLKATPGLASLLVDSLVELRLACHHYDPLESSVFSRLLFNFQLWFGGASKASGVSLHSTLLPLLSSITNATPHKVRDLIGVRPMIELLNEYTDVGETEEKYFKFAKDPTTELFDRGSASGLKRNAPLTLKERRHAVDVNLGMVATILVSGCTSSQLLPLLQYISHNADFEWELGSREANQGRNPNVRVGTRHERHLSNVKACSVFLFLMKGHPPVEGLLSSLSEDCGGTQGTASWILCTLVNTFDDEIRSLGIRCLADYLDVAIPKGEHMLSTTPPKSPDEPKVDAPFLQATLNTKSAKQRLAMTISNVGKTFSALNTRQVLSQIIPTSKPVSVDIVYKLLWHLLKCHRMRIGTKTHNALIHLLLEDRGLNYDPEFLMQELVTSDDVLHTGYRLSLKLADTMLVEFGSVAGKKLRKSSALNVILRLLRFLGNIWKEKWLRDLVDMIITCPPNVAIIVTVPEWQPSLFHVVSDILEEIQTRTSMSIDPTQTNNDRDVPSAETGDPDVNRGRSGDLRSEPTEQHKPLTFEEQTRLHARFNLSLKLYSYLLAHCFRQGGEKGIAAVEQMASLERVCVNGHIVVCLVLNYLLSELIEKGTVDTIRAKGGNGESNWYLKESSRIVTTAILSNGANSSGDAAFAVRQWHGLRHLAAVTGCLITKSGFGMGDLFNRQIQDSGIVDDETGGIYGVRLPDGNVGALNAIDYNKTVAQDSKNLPRLYRRVCVMLAAQTLTLLDAFIFPDSLDASLPASQLHGLALVRGGEGRLGVSQGPILASLIRMSLVLICNLEPSGVKFLQCCSRLRCFLHWSLELIRESVALAGYSAAFHDLTAPLDRLVLATVLHGHKALARSSVALDEIEKSEFEKYFKDGDAKKKNVKRVLRVSFELREIIVTAFRGRNEVVRASLCHTAFQALQKSLEHQVPGSRSKRMSSKEATVRAFLKSKWVIAFQDAQTVRRDVFPMLGNLKGEDQRLKSLSQRGYLAVEELSDEATEIVLEFNRALNAAFLAYCEDQKNWAETDAVRDLEFEGDTCVKKLSAKHKTDMTESARSATTRSSGAQNRLKAVDRRVTELWDSHKAKWRVSRHTDCLGRRILLTRNRNFDSHQKASYEVMLGLEREKAAREREERMKKRKEKELQEKAQAAVRKNAAYIAYGTDDEESLVEEMGDDSAYLDDSTTMFQDLGDFIRANNGESRRDILLPDDSNASVSRGFGDAATVDTEYEIVDRNAFNDCAEEDVDAWAKTFIWSETESVVARFDGVMVVTLRTITEGRLLLTTHGLYFNQTGDVINVMTKEKGFNADSDAMFENRDLRWRLSRLTEVHGRRFMLRAQAIELFFSDSIELFLNFTGGTRERDRFYAKLRNSCKVPLLWSPKSLNPRVVFKKSKVTQLWKKGKISNFQYIMHLNKMAGRTFNDITQYPVFPWVLCDYTSENIDLDDPNVYRDLSKPVGALNPDRLATLVERYNDLASFGFSDEEKFLYGSHYSSPGVVLHYLIRQEPFTSMAIELQSGRFDCPDRLFFDIAGCWRSCLTSTSDVKELVPELFTCPEVFLNTNKFPLGSTQDGRSISDVGLPPWAKGSAFEFVRIHRLALESEHVSRSLHNWIDLIFGYKQRGPEAEAAHNVFHYLSYEGAVDMSKITDEIERKAAESHIQNFGQTPSQLLLKDPHPSRGSSEERWKPLIRDERAPLTLRCHTPGKQFGFRQAKGAVLGIHVLTDALIAIYSDLSIGTYKFSSSRGGRQPFSFRADKHRALARRELSFSRSVMKRGSAAPHAMEENNSHYAVGNWSFAMTVGGEAKESMRRKAHTSRNVDSIRDAETTALVLSCCYFDNCIKIHSLDGLRLQGSFNGGHRGPIRCLAMGSDGALMVTGGQDATCRVWVVDHPDMASALSGGYVQTVMGEAYDSRGIMTCCHILWGHDSAITCLDINADLDVVVSGSISGTLCVHTVRRGRFIRSFKPAVKYSAEADGAIRKIALDNTGMFIVHTDDGYLHSFTVNGVRLHSQDAEEAIHDMKICSQGEILVTGGEKGHVVIRRTRDLAIISVLDISQHGPIRCITLTPEDLNPIPQFMFIGSDDGMVTVVDEDPDKKMEAN